MNTFIYYTPNQRQTKIYTYKKLLYHEGLALLNPYQKLGDKLIGISIKATLFHTSEIITLRR
jgi:hypothetical protein